MEAVGRGETIVTALQDAVPEDVREKLTTSVTAILESKGSKLKFPKLSLPSLSPGMKKTEEARKEPSSSTDKKDSHSPDPKNKSDGLVSGPDNAIGGSDNSTGGTKLEHSSSEASQKDGNSKESQPTDSEKTSASNDSEKASEAKVDNTNLKQPVGKEDVSTDDDKVDQGDVIAKGQRQEENDKNDEKGAPMAKTDSTNEGHPTGGDDLTSDKEKVDTGQQQTKEETSKNDDNAEQSTTDQNKVASNGNEGDVGESSASSSGDKEGIDGQNKETKVSEPVSDETKPAIQEPNQAKLNVSQAFEALTGMDDSTQVAVNSVFGVLENMITQLDEEKKEKNGVSDEKDPKDEMNVTDEKNPKDKKNVTNEKNATDEGIRSSSVEKTPYKKEASNEHETGKGSDNDKKTLVVNEKDLGGNESVIDKQLPKNLPKRIPNFLENASTEEFSEEQIAKQLDDTTTALMLDYYPEEGKWKLLDQQPGYSSDNAHGNGQVRSSSENNEQKIIEPSYVILDHEQEGELSKTHDAVDDQDDCHHSSDEGCEELEHLIKVIVSDSLSVEVQRRMNSAGMRQFESQLHRDIERVANTLSFAVVHSEPTWTFNKNSKISNSPVRKVGTLRGDSIIRAISSAVQEAHFLRKVLPVGVVVGSVLAALRKYFDVSTTTDNAKRDIVMGKQQHGNSSDFGVTTTTDNAERDIVMGKQKHENNSAVNSVVLAKTNQKTEQKNLTMGEMMESGLQNIRNEPVMVGAMTAALGASAMMVQHEDPQSGGMMSKASDNNMVASFAEKAMSIAGPAVPTKETGEVDQERIVTMLADLGQRGGILRLVGKLALLWGGLRGAMSLTEKLIQFLHMEDWPLVKRVVGFVGMVVVLWSPVLIPLLPTLLQSWSTSTPSKVAELASVAGLYVAVLILVMLWGKRVRKYENPFRQYGLDFKASAKKQIQDFLKALAGGIVVVLLIQSINTIIGAAFFSRPPYFPHPFDAMKWLKGSVQLLLLMVKGLSAAACVVSVEELLFRSWLPNELAIELGYHPSIIISGLVFALFQRSLRSIPGLWLLSLGLAGVRERSQGNLIIPIGLRTGVIAASFILHSGGFLTYNSSSPVWIAGTRPLQPFSGVVGLVVSLALAVSLYPRQPPETKMQKYE